jgi:hypothetical protein
LFAEEIRESMIKQKERELVVIYFSNTQEFFWFFNGAAKKSTKPTRKNAIFFLCGMIWTKMQDSWNFVVNSFIR